jgi:hypothetical protein
VTLSSVEPLIWVEAAEIVVLPAATPVARPVEFMVATLVAEELHAGGG